MADGSTGGHSELPRFQGVMKMTQVNPSGNPLALALAYVLPPKVRSELVELTLHAYEHASNGNLSPTKDNPK